jgi:tRNA-specific 2-thiouridylase
MSGGVDSACAALRLKSQGHEVEGITGRFWGGTGASLSQDAEAAPEICRVLGIPHRFVDLRSEFGRAVVDPFISAYARGVTPNPCAWCNRDVKLGKLADLARDRGFDFVATGHYARLAEVDGRITLCEPLDKRKSQLYFLALVDPRMLEFLMLPLGDCRKDDVKRLVKDAGLPARTRDSQDLCFVAGKRYHDFLSRRVQQPGTGKVLDVDGRALGTHRGHTAYTVGQRFGIRGRRYYVLEKRPERNEIVVGKKEMALKTAITASLISLFLPLSDDDATVLSVRYRYNSPPVQAKIVLNGRKRIEAMTAAPCFAPAPGQILAGYKKGCLVFGGIIESAG